MGRKIFAVVFSLLLTFIFAAPARAERPGVTAAAAVLMDAGNGQIYFSKKGEARREPASLTKIMTAIIALEYGNLQEEVTISRRAASVAVGQDIGLKAGDRITLENLLKAALLYSANDSTVAIAEHVAGSEKEFVGMMNAKAVLLGAHHTRFANTNGYHNPNHYTTATDLALITRYALQIKKFAELVSTREDTIRWVDGREKEVRNTNRLLRDDSFQGICGVKTGSTPRAGDCLIAAAFRGDRKLIAVVLHSHARYRDAVKLLDYGFNHVVPVALCSRSELVASQQVIGGLEKEVPVVTGRAVEFDLAEDDREAVKKNVSLGEPPHAPVRVGQKLGEVVYTLNGKELARVELVAARDIPKPGLFRRLKEKL